MKYVFSFLVALSVSSTYAADSTSHGAVGVSVGSSLAAPATQTGLKGVLEPLAGKSIVCKSTYSPYFRAQVSSGTLYVSIDGYLGWTSVLSTTVDSGNLRMKITASAAGLQGGYTDQSNSSYNGSCSALWPAT